MRAALLLALLLGGCSLTRGPSLAANCSASLPDQEVACYCSESGAMAETITAP